MPARSVSFLMRRIGGSQTACQVGEMHSLREGSPRPASSFPMIRIAAEACCRLLLKGLLLLQDYLYVVEFTRFLARTLAAAPRAHFDTLIGGLSALQDELFWYQVTLPITSTSRCLHSPFIAFGILCLIGLCQWPQLALVVNDRLPLSSLDQC